MDIDLWRKVGDDAENGRLDKAVDFLEHELGGCKSLHFRGLLGGDFTNSPASVADHINDFTEFCERCFPVEAVYLEMNGFDINVHRWYFESFGYRHYVDTADNLEWLSPWDSADYPTVTLTGLEPVQRDYDWYSNHEGHKDEDARVAEQFAVLLVMCKFGRLVSRAVATGKIRKHLPILATAHDFDIIPKFRS